MIINDRNQFWLNFLSLFKKISFKFVKKYYLNIFTPVNYIFKEVSYISNILYWTILSEIGIELSIIFKYFTKCHTNKDKPKKVQKSTYLT